MNEEIIYSPKINDLLQSVCSIVDSPKEVDEYNIFSVLEISDKEVIVTADYSSAKFEIKIKAAVSARSQRPYGSLFFCR